jgi:MFS family permease
MIHSVKRSETFGVGPEESGRSPTDGVQAPPSLPATVRALGWTSFLTDFSSEAIYPLLPGFVKGLGGTGVEIGLIDGIANAVAAVVRLPSGAISDVIGRRPLVLAGYGLSAVVRPLMAFAASPVHVLLVRAADRFGKGVRAAPRDALVADLVAPAARGSAFGHIRALDHAGAAVGPLAAMLFLLVFPGQERRLFLLAILPGLATLAVIWAAVRDAPRHVSAAPRDAIAAGLSRPQAWLLGCVGVWALGAASEQFLLLRAADVGVPQPLVPLVWFGMSLAKSGAAARAGRIADRVAPRAMLALGWLLFAAAYGGLALTGGLPAAIALFVCVGIAYGIAEPAERALVAALAADGRHGAAFGWYALVQGLMALPAGLLAGWLWDSGPGGPATSFAVTAALAVAACGLLFLGRTAPAASSR